MDILDVKIWAFDIAGYCKYIKVAVTGGVPADGLKIYPFGACGGVEKIVFLYQNAENTKYILMYNINNKW